jgi:hypothetical protein
MITKELRFKSMVDQDLVGRQMDVWMNVSKSWLKGLLIAV